MGIVAFYVDENVRRFGSSTSSGQADPAARASQPARAAQHPARTSAAARGILSEGLDLAFRQGGLRLADRGHQELAIAGGKPRRDALRGARDALTPSELRVAQLAAAGTTKHQIA
jgi:DNA-binding NarL/FixJ family response regulator